MPKVFISHSSADDPFVERLRKRLEAASVEVWIDSRRIVPGDDILEKVEQGLASSTHAIIVFSPASLLSNWVREESHAAQLTAIAGSSRIIPLIYGAMSPSAIPLLLRSRLYVDFRDPASFDDSVNQLLSAFDAEVDEPSSTTDSPLEIADVQVASRPADSGTAVELLLANQRRRVLNIRRVSLRSMASSCHL